MFVRWQTRKRKQSHLGGLLTCTLMESRRIDGKPRQRVIAYLASIRDAMYTNHRIWFWQRVDYALNDLNLDPDALACIRADIMKRVPYTTEVERLDRQDILGELRERNPDF